MENDITMETLQQFSHLVHFHIMNLMMPDTRSKQPTHRTPLEAHHPLYPRTLTALVDFHHLTFSLPQTGKKGGKLRHIL
jgi:hypothetical protein